MAGSGSRPTPGLAADCSGSRSSTPHRPIPVGRSIWKDSGCSTSEGCGLKVMTVEMCDMEIRRLWNLNKRYPEGQSNSARLTRIDDFLELRLNIQRARSLEAKMCTVGSPQRV